MNCCNCDRKVQRIQAADVYPCFHCMKLNTVVTYPGFALKAHPLVRKSSKDWKIGTNVQTQKNQLWEIQLEELYERWLNERILE